MKKFDLHNYFFLKEAENPDEEENTQGKVLVPNQASPNPEQSAPQNSQNAKQAPPKSNPNVSKDELLKKQTSESSNVFSNFVGSTISDISFKKTGGNGGEISISISKSNMPIKISWVGDKVTVTQPNGNIVSL